MTIQEYAQKTGLHPNTIYKRIRNGKLRAKLEVVKGKSTWLIEEAKENARVLR